MRYRIRDRLLRQFFNPIYFFIIIIFFHASISHSNEPYIKPSRQILFEATGGYSRLNGYYDSKLDSSPAYSLKVSTDIVSPFFIQGIFSYSSYEFMESSGSYINRYSFYLGPAIRYQFYGPLFLVGGLYATGNYFTLRARELDYYDNTYKTGFALSAGLALKITSELRGEAGFIASQTLLSGHPFRDVSLYAGAGYSFNFYPAFNEEKYKEAKKTLTEIEQVESYYNSGKKSYDEGKISEAEESFTRLVNLKGNYRDVQDYLAKVKGIKEDLESAERLIFEKKNFQAIPLLIKWEKNVPDARNRLESLRRDMAVDAIDIEKKGVEAFEKKDYRESIKLLNRALLINPGSKQSILYLNRARRYLNTIEKYR